ncbi:unnamed protein product, partial [Acanthoscelides obtectus]
VSSIDLRGGGRFSFLFVFVFLLTSLPDSKLFPFLITSFSETLTFFLSCSTFLLSALFSSSILLYGELVIISLLSALRRLTVVLLLEASGTGDSSIRRE